VSTVVTRVGTFVWHEQVSSDPAKAKEFYGQLFGWGTEVFKPGEIDYQMISVGGKTHGGFSTAQEGAPPPHWLGHVRVENVEETIPVPEDFTGDGTLFMLRVRGDSMIDAGIFEGDLVVVEKRAAAQKGDIVVAIVDNQFTLKRLDLESGRFVLKPENRAFPVIRPEGDLEIFGVMVGLVRKI